MFKLNGRPFMCLDGGNEFNLSGAISFFTEVYTQEQLDEIWNKMLDGGKTMECGWITDRYGVTWQIAPKALGEMMSDPNATEAQKQAVNDAMTPMIKLDEAKLREAFENAK